MRSYKNVTIALPLNTWRRARIWSAQHDYSLSALVEDLLENLPILPRIEQLEADFKARIAAAEALESSSSASSSSKH